ncbi:MAG TPA: ubiquinol-cytochrome c reductase iron-sulfur subunit [Blastocatellia bacterium]|nr:ubiquinol-cytochrome c reductase iron-sulfur subunit [Blastocatellia bacterium]
MEQAKPCTESVDRRSWLGLMIGFIGAAITAMLAIPLGRFAIAPAFTKSNEAAWLDLGALSAIPEHQLVRKNILITQEAGWGRFNAPRLLWIVRKGDDVKIFSGVCPHLGCSVNAKEESFICVCHGSKWNTEGEKIIGPAPRNLDALEYKIENGILKVHYQDFKQGATTKEVLS